MTGNPNIAEYGKDTRFSSENQPETNSASVRSAERRLAGFEFEGGRITVEQMHAALRRKDAKGLTGAQLLGVSRFLLAMEGHEKFSQNVTEDIDGKLKDVVEVQRGVDSMTDDEIEARLAELRKREARDNSA